MFSKILHKFTIRRALSALKKQPVNFTRWKIVRELSCIRYHSSVEKARLRTLSARLLQQKVFVGELGLDLTDEMKLIIAAQACVPILKVGLNYYSGFVQVSVYPDAFWVERDESDTAGIVHHKKALLSGESWSRGPVILSWRSIEDELQHDHDGRNVVIHEFAHKIDMINRGANGMPPLSAGSSAQEWHDSFQQAYLHLIGRTEHHHKPCVNAYGATSPAEFYAVVSEYFFTAPQRLMQCYPRVYNELKLFYRQDPATDITEQKRKRVMNKNQG